MMHIRNEQEIPNSLIAPSQWQDMTRPGFSSALKLQLAILQEALTTRDKRRGRQGVASRRVFREVESWFWDDTREGFGSVFFCCHHLGIDLGALRRRLRAQDAASRVAPLEEPIKVCGACLSRLCYLGRKTCSAYFTSRATLKTRTELRELGKEESDYWDKLMERDPGE